MATPDEPKPKPQPSAEQVANAASFRKFLKERRTSAPTPRSAHELAEQEAIKKGKPKPLEETQSTVDQ